MTSKHVEPNADSGINAQAEVDQHKDAAHTAHELSLDDHDIANCLALMERVWSTANAAPRAGQANFVDLYSHNWQARDIEIDWGRFVLRRQLGQGTYGIVFLAFDKLTRREVAVKIPQAHVLSNADSLKRFLGEAEAAAILDHPGIVPVYEVGEVNGVTFIVSAYCRGPNLADWLSQQNRPVAPFIAASLIARMASAIHYAHSRGVLHRDLKPANVLLDEDVSRSDRNPCLSPRITDFGLAKIAGASATATRDGTLIGSFRYMSPEQASGRTKDIGVQADVWALGAILYELLANRAAFTGDDVSILNQIQEQEPPPLASLGLAIPADLINICHCCLLKELPHRYRSAKELLTDLERFSRGEPVAARPLGPMARSIRWTRRRPVIATLAAALFLVAITGLTGVLWQWKRADAEAIAAKQETARAAIHLAQAKESLRDLAWMVQELGLYCHPEDKHLADVANVLKIYIQKSESTSIDSQSQRSSFAAGRMFYANISTLSGDYEGALANFEAGVTAWRQIVHDQPANRSYRRALALGLYCYGVSLKQSGRNEGAQEQLKAAREVFLTTNEDVQEKATALLKYAEMVSSLGRSFELRGRGEEALTAYCEASAVARESFDLDPHSTVAAFNAASMTSQLARFHARVHDSRQAVTDYDNAREVVGLLLTKEPYDESGHILALDVELARAQLHRRLNAWHSASRAYAEAIRVAESGLNKFLDKPVWSSRLAVACHEFGLSKLERKETTGAQFILEKANTHWEIAARAKQLSDQHAVKWAVVCYELARLYRAQDQPEKMNVNLQRAAGLFIATKGKVPNTPKTRQARDGCQALLVEVRGPFSLQIDDADVDFTESDLTSMD